MTQRRPSNPSKPQGRFRAMLPGGLLVLLALAIYWPALHAGFIWDDDPNITENLPLRSLGGLRQIWFEPGATQQFYPLTYSNLWLDYHLWQLNPLGYHLENVFWHAVGAVLLWRVLLRLKVPGAWLGAALFAAHPVCVESVAWATERKNTLSGVCFLASLLMGAKFWLPEPPANAKAPEPKYGPWKFYWLGLFFYLCALLAKTSTVGLPVAILLMLWWKRRLPGTRAAALLLPFFAAGVAMGLMTMHVEKEIGATGADFVFSPLERLLTAAGNVWFYLEKLVWPNPLIFFYPRRLMGPSQPVAWLAPAALVIGGFWLWRKRETWGRPALFACAYFIVMLFPVLGFFNVSFFQFSFVSDHFQYLACMGPLAFASAGIVTTLNRGRASGVLPVAIIGGVLLVALGILAERQTRIYRNVDTLWRDTLAKNPESWTAHYDMGNAMLRAGDWEGAIRHYSAALKSNPRLVEARNNLGEALSRNGDLSGAFEQFSTALQTEPDNAAAHFNLGNILSVQGKADDAIREYMAALKKDPDFAVAHFHLANLLAATGKLDDASAHYSQAARLKPDLAEAHFGLGNILATQGKLDDAARQYGEVIRLQPANAAAHYNLANMLAAEARLDEAITEYRAALRIVPTDPQTHFNLGLVFALQEKRPEAREQFAEALRLQPDFAKAAAELQKLGAPGKN